MKKQIRIFAIVSLFLIGIIMSSCQKTPSDTAAFEKLTEESGYNLYDITVQYDALPQIKEVKLAVPDSRAFQIEFYVITDMDNAKKLFLVQCEEIEGFKGVEFTGDSSNGQNYARRSVVTKGQYLMVSYIENTVVYVPPTDDKNKDEIEKFLKKLNY